MNILLLDIETAPNIGYFWGLFDQNISHDQIVESSYILCWSAQWYGSKEMIHEYVRDKWAPRKRMLQRAHRLLNAADIVIHFNGKKFDIPVLNKEFLKHRIAPPSPYKQIDLYRVVREQFRFESNKMTALAKQLSIEEKLEHEGFQMWVGCMEGDAKRWATMTAYNKQDVVMLGQLYPLLLPWITNHPKMNLDTPSSCPRCGSPGPLHHRGKQITKMLVYQRYQCQACRGWCRSYVSVKQPKPRYV